MIRFYFFIPLLFACFLPAGAQTTAGQTENAYRFPGQFTLQAAGGAANGGRLQLRYATSGSTAWEVSCGYIKLTSRPDKFNYTLKNDGLSTTMGFNVFTYPANDLSPFFSFLVSYVIPRQSDTYHWQERWIVSLTFGTEYFLTRHFSTFFRFGPNVHFLSEAEGSNAQVNLQFDAGLGWSF